MPDGSIVFKTKIDTSGLSSDAKKVARTTQQVINDAEKASAASAAAVKKQAQMVAALEAKLKELQNKDPRTPRYAAATDRAEELRSRIYGMEQRRSGITGNSFGDTKQRAELTAQISAAKKELEGLISDINDMESKGKAFSNVGDEISKVSEELSNAKDLLEEYEQQESSVTEESRRRIAEALASYRKITDAERRRQEEEKASAQRAAADRKAQQEQGALIGGVFGQTGIQIAGAVSGDPMSIIGLIKTGIDAVGGSLRKIGDSLKNVLKQIGQFVKRLFSGNGQLKSLVNRIIRLTASALLFNKLSRAMNDMSNALTTALEKNADYNSAMSQLKGNVMAAFAPIWNVAVPALTALINLLARAAGYLAQFSAVLSGGTVSGAEAAASALWDQATAAEASGSASAEAARQLAGFDDLTRLEESNSGGGGSSSSGTITPNIGNELIDMISAGDYSGIGEMLGERLSAAFDAAAKKIKWDNAKSTITRVLEGIADFINGFFRAGPLDSLGTVIGESITTALSSIGVFVAAIDWSAIGRDISRGINNAAKAIDWKTIKKNLRNGTREIASGINTGIRELDWNGVGGTIGEGMDTAICVLAGSIKDLDWESLGSGVSDMIVGALDEIDDGEIGAAILSVIDAGISFFAGMDLGTISAQLARIMVSAFFGAVPLMAKGLVEVIADLLSMVSLSMMASGGPIAIALAIGIQIGKLILQGLINGVAGTDGTFWDRFTLPFKNIINFVSSIFGVKGSSSTVFTNIGKAIVQGLINGVNGLLTALKKPLNSMIGTLETWANLCIRAVNGAIDALNRISITIPKIPGVTPGFTLKPNIAKSYGVTIPRLAQGAVIPPNSEFMAVLGDQTHGNNIEAPEGLIRRIVREESGNADILNDILEAIRAGQVIAVDRKVLGQVVRAELNRDARTAGTAVIGGG